MGADPGVGAERTAMAWQRTALALAAGSAAVARLGFHALGLASLASIATGLPLAGWILRHGRARYRGGVLPDGVVPAIVAVAAFGVLSTSLLAITLR